jgi:hypothetical protein
MDLIAELAGVFLEGLVGAVRPKPAPNICPRCRKAPVAVQAPGMPQGTLVCEACAVRIARNHRSGLLFLSGLALLIVVAGLVMVLTRAR